MRLAIQSLSILFLFVFTIVLTPKIADSLNSSEKLVKVEYSELDKFDKKEIDCLAQNIYHEARSEPVEGKQAVAMVTMNRTQDERFPSSICSVVKQKRNKVCQFSWFCMPVKLDKNSDAYRESLEAALYVWANYQKLYDVTKGALFYHADYVRPNWKGLERTVRIGRHIFYKEGVKI